LVPRIFRERGGKKTYSTSNKPEGACLSRPLLFSIDFFKKQLKIKMNYEINFL